MNYRLQSNEPEDAKPVLGIHPGTGDTIDYFVMRIFTDMFYSKLKALWKVYPVGSPDNKDKSEREGNVLILLRKSCVISNCIRTHTIYREA